MLEGEKLVLLHADKHGTGVQTYLCPDSDLHLTDKPVTEEHLKSLKRQAKEDVGGQAAIARLTAGQAVYVGPGVWHAAVNLSACISINVSVCPPHRLLKSVVDTIDACAFVELFKSEGVAVMGPAFLAVVEKGLQLFSQQVQDALAREHAPSVADMLLHPSVRDSLLQEWAKWHWVAVACQRRGKEIVVVEKARENPKSPTTPFSFPAFCRPCWRPTTRCAR